MEEYTRLLLRPQQSDSAGEGWLAAPGDIDDFVFFVQEEWSPSER